MCLSSLLGLRKHSLPRDKRSVKAAALFTWAETGQVHILIDELTGSGTPIQLKLGDPNSVLV
jgi:hypothetical protein